MIVADVSQRDQVFAAVDRVENDLGGFDTIINNAGIAQVKPLADMLPEDIERIFRVKCRQCLVGHPGGGCQDQDARSQG
jgi:NAD(P)-dependent dehydrogenase (short-subunit alcohol dehydrogenase family)